MASAALPREKYLLTLGIVKMLDKRYVALPMKGEMIQMNLTNLRNRPLSRDCKISMHQWVLSLYHNLVTGSRDFPYIPYKGFLRRIRTATPFAHAKRGQRENVKPSSPVIFAPAGMTVPTASSDASPPASILTPVLPERAELRLLRADNRNVVRNIDFNGTSFTRVISTVYHSESTELANRWRVTDYSANGQVRMSVLCQFLKKSATCAMGSKQEKRKNTEEESSSEEESDSQEESNSQSSPKKRMRM